MRAKNIGWSANGIKPEQERLINAINEMSILRANWTTPYTIPRTDGWLYKKLCKIQVDLDALESCLDLTEQEKMLSRDEI